MVAGLSAGEDGGDVAALDLSGFGEEGTGGDGFVDGEDGGEGFDDELDGFFGGAHGLVGFGGDEDDGVAEVGDFVVGEEVFVFDDGADDVVARDFFGGDDGGDAGKGFGGGDIDGKDATVGDWGADDIDNEFVVKRRHIIDKNRLSSDVAYGGFVGDIFAYNAHGW